MEVGVNPVTITMLRTVPTVSLMTAAAALGLGRTKAYTLARQDAFPCRVIRIGEVYRVPTPGLLELLGISADGAQPPAPAESRTGSDARNGVPGPGADRSRRMSR
jgi:hypothetical protein